MNENMTGYIKALQAFQGERYQGSLIGKIAYSRQAKAGPTARFTAEVVKDRKRFQLLRITGWEQHQQVGQLELLLFWQATKVNNDNEYSLPKEASREALPPGVYWKAFTPQEVYAFSQATGDDNAIHLTERPVVQGLLLWQELFSKLGEPSRMEVIFQEPVHAGEGIYLEEEQHEQRNQSNFTFCPGNPGQPSQFHPGPDHQRRLRGTAGRIGLHFFSLAFYPGHGDGPDHYGESGGVPENP